MIFFPIEAVSLSFKTFRLACFSATGCSRTSKSFDPAQASGKISNIVTSGVDRRHTASNQPLQCVALSSSFKVFFLIVVVLVRICATARVFE